MPTPFMHMAVAHHLLGDPTLSAKTRAALANEPGAYLLGNVAADARVSSGLQRIQTHFFDYTPVIDPPAGVLMLRAHPELSAENAHSSAQRAFVAGYLAHLAMDVIWATDMLYAGFGGTWGTQTERFHMLHMLLAYLDARDYATLPTSDGTVLRSASPRGWLPFMGDIDLIGWRDLIAAQFDPEVGPQTLTIFAPRIGWTPLDMDRFIHDPAQMQSRLFAHIPLSMIADVEARMYAGARDAIQEYYADPQPIHI